MEYKRCWPAAAVMTIAVCCTVNAVHAQPWQLTGDLRLAWQGDWRDARDGESSSSDALNSRVRLRLRHDLGDNWRFQTRLAGTFRDSGNDFDLFLRPERATPTAVEPGSVTPDEFFLQYRSPDRRTELRFGRLQSSLKLPLVTEKSLDRNQASNVNIGWTDGIYLGHRFSEHWKATLTAQYNDRDGNGTATRGPLDFRDSGSRASAFATLESEREIGPLFMRALTLTWYPDALAVDGVAGSKREDYLNATWKMGAGWDLASGMRVIVAGEAGYAFNTPPNSVMGLPGRGDADGLAWQFGADLVGFLPGHQAGLVIGQADAGWLISNDYRQNDSLAEFRWRWHVQSSLVLEMRTRWRYEQDRRLTAPEKQRDRDIRFRITYSF
ncbi:MAG: hypothetical protein ACNA7E_05380 [Wenzhouxiangellaceae bacterium]